MPFETAMTAGGPGSHHLKRSTWVMAAAFAAVGFASAQQTDSLEQQLQQLKKQYDETTRALEQRIAGLEQRIEKEKRTESRERPREGTITSVDLAAEEAQKAILGQSDQV